MVPVAGPEAGNLPQAGAAAIEISPTYDDVAAAESKQVSEAESVGPAYAGDSAIFMLEGVNVQPSSRKTSVLGAHESTAGHQQLG